MKKPRLVVFLLITLALCIGITAILYIKTSPVIAWPSQARACSICHDLEAGVTTTASVSELSLMPGETSQAFTVTVNGAGYHSGYTGSALRLPTSWIAGEDYTFGHSTETDGEWYWTENRGDPDHTETFTATITVPSDAPAGDYIIDVWGAGCNVDGKKASDSTTITVTVTIVSPPVASFTFQPQTPVVNETVTFNATGSYDSDGTIISYDWDFGDGTTISETNPVTTHAYEVEGTYLVKLTVIDNDALNDTATAYVTVSLAIVHDIAVTNVTAFPTEVTVGDSVFIRVDVKNEGDVPESFNLTSYYDTTVIETKTVTDLAPHTEASLTFTWGTHGVSEGNYTIKAVASTVSGETDTADNSYVDGMVTVTPARILEASIDLDPDTLNLKSRGKWISCYIELPEGYNVSDIDRATILLNGTIPVDPFWVDKPLESVVGDYDNDAIPDLMVKFNRIAVSDYILNQNQTYGNVTLAITVELYDGTPFEGSDTIRVLPKANQVSPDLAKTSNFIPNPLIVLFAINIPLVSGVLTASKYRGTQTRCK